MDHSDASGSSTFFWFLYLFFLMKYYGSIVIFPTFSVYFVSLVLSASPFSSKLVNFLLIFWIFELQLCKFRFSVSSLTVWHIYSEAVI